MSSFLQTKDISSPPSTPPNRPLQRQRTSYIMNAAGPDSIMDKVRLDNIGKAKNTFQQLTEQQRRLFLSEILGCCDNQLLQYVHTFISPKLKIDFLKKLPIELSLLVLSFIDDPRTLARVSLVSRRWNSLTKDEAAWEALCLKHHYRLSCIGTMNQQQQQQQHMSYRDFFRRKYSIDTAWNQGGKVILCENQIEEGLATSLQMDETYTAVGCDNHRIEVYNSHNGDYIRSLQGHEGGVWALQFIKTENNQHILVSGGCDRTARVWNLDTGELLHVLSGHLSTIRCLQMVDDRTVVTGSRDTTLRVWDIKDGDLIHVLTGHQGSVRCIAVHGDKVASGSYDSTARLWDMHTGECLHEFVGHHSQIYAIAFDGVRVVTGSLDSNIRVWSAETGDCITTLLGHTSLVSHLHLSNNILVSGGSDGCLRVWDMVTLECKHRISAHDNSITCLQFDDKRIISSSSDGHVKLWDLQKGTFIRALTATARTVWKVQMSDTKAVAVLQRGPENESRSAIELHNFDAHQ